MQENIQEAIRLHEAGGKAERQRLILKDDLSDSPLSS